jgi:hypothetical protein
MRVNAHFIDAQSGRHIWADRFDGPVTDLIEMRDEIVARIANTLNAQVIAVEARRSDRAPAPGPMDLYFLGQAWVNKAVTFENHDQGARLLRARPDPRSRQCRSDGGHGACWGQFRDQSVHAGPS